MATSSCNCCTILSSNCLDFPAKTEAKNITKLNTTFCAFISQCFDVVYSKGLTALYNVWKSVMFERFFLDVMWFLYILCSYLEAKKPKKNSPAWGALIRWMFFLTSLMASSFSNCLPFFNLQKNNKKIVNPWPTRQYVENANEMSITNDKPVQDKSGLSFLFYFFHPLHGFHCKTKSLYG